MPVETLVIFQDNVQLAPSSKSGPKVLDTLGDNNNMAIQLREMLESVQRAVQSALSETSELTIEISGALELKANAGVQYLIFNVSGETSKTNTMTVTLKTNLAPKKN